MSQFQISQLDDLTKRLVHCETYCRIEVKNTPTLPNPKTIVKFSHITPSEDITFCDVPPLQEKVKTGIPKGFGTQPNNRFEELEGKLLEQSIALHKEMSEFNG